MGEWQGEKEESDANGLRAIDKQVLFLANHNLGIKATATALGVRPSRVKEVRRRVKEVLGVSLDQDFANAILVARQRHII